MKVGLQEEVGKGDGERLMMLNNDGDGGVVEVD
jgi:hypothetical protein